MLHLAVSLPPSVSCCEPYGGRYDDHTHTRTHTVSVPVIWLDEVAVTEALLNCIISLVESSLLSPSECKW